MMPGLGIQVSMQKAFTNKYPLVICYIAMEAMAAVEIDGLPAFTY